MICSYMTLPFIRQLAQWLCIYVCEVRLPELQLVRRRRSLLSNLQYMSFFHGSQKLKLKIGPKADQF